VDDVDNAVRHSLPTVLELTRSLNASRVPLHFPLHDGHPLIAGLSDHFSFFIRQPIPFDHNGRWSLPPMYGPQGLVAIVIAAMAPHVGPEPVFTMEIHQAEGRLPLDDDARQLFGHWRDLTNAERMNYWLSVLADNACLAVNAIAGIENKV